MTLILADDVKRQSCHEPSSYAKELNIKTRLRQSMIYYICIANPIDTFIRTSPSDIVSMSIRGHQTLGASVPNLINEMMTFTIVTTREAVKKLNISRTDTVRLSLAGVKPGYKSFNIEEVGHVMDIWEEIKLVNTNVNPQCNLC